MAKLAVQVVADPRFFSELTDEAARLDRSPSWLLGRCLALQKPALSSLDAGALAGSVPPPKAASRRFFMEREIYEAFDAAGDRLRVPFDAVVRWAFERSRPDLDRIAS